MSENTTKVDFRDYVKRNVHSYFVYVGRDEEDCGETFYIAETDYHRLLDALVEFGIIPADYTLGDIPVKIWLVKMLHEIPQYQLGGILHGVTIDEVGSEGYNETISNLKAHFNYVFMEHYPIVRFGSHIILDQYDVVLIWYNINSFKRFIK